MYMITRKLNTREVVDVRSYEDPRELGASGYDASKYIVTIEESDPRQKDSMGEEITGGFMTDPSPGNA